MNKLIKNDKWLIKMYIFFIFYFKNSQTRDIVLTADIKIAKNAITNLFLTKIDFLFCTSTTDLLKWVMPHRIVPVACQLIAVNIQYFWCRMCHNFWGVLFIGIILTKAHHLSWFLHPVYILHFPPFSASFWHLRKVLKLTLERFWIFIHDQEENPSTIHALEKKSWI